VYTITYLGQQKTDLRINIANPVSWLMEIMRDNKKGSKRLSAGG